MFGPQQALLIPVSSSENFIPPFAGKGYFIWLHTDRGEWLSRAWHASKQLVISTWTWQTLFPSLLACPQSVERAAAERASVHGGHAQVSGAAERRCQSCCGSGIAPILAILDAISFTHLNLGM